ncbi:MAG: DUF6596 domain-containing protein [Pseudomonadota bacterium]
MSDAARAAEAAARASYGRLVAILAARSRDITAAEDALAEAFAKALTTWPQTGVPDKPDAWLLTTARNRLTDTQRRDSRLTAMEDAPEAEVPDMPDFEDHRLGLMFACAHPAIDRATHTPLMLQTVLGVEARDLARAFALGEAAMAQRLVRAKTKIKKAGIPFTRPSADQLPPRRAAVCEAIYGAWSLDWMQAGDALGMEAFYLAQLVARLEPEHPEALGLVALIGFGLARRDARLVNSVLVPLPEQDTTLWDQELIDGAAHTLGRAQAMGQIGRFQLEAAIQAVHAHRKATGVTNWQAIAQLTGAVAQMFPTLGAAVSHAVAAAEAAGDPQAGLVRLSQIPAQMAQNFQPFWAARAHLSAQAGHLDDAQDAYFRAEELAADAPTRAYLSGKRDKLRQS